MLLSVWASSSVSPPSDQVRAARADRVRLARPEPHLFLGLLEEEAQAVFAGTVTTEGNMSFVETTLTTAGTN